MSPTDRHARVDDKLPATGRAIAALFLVGVVLAGMWIGLVAYDMHRTLTDDGPIRADGAFVTDYDGRVIRDALEGLVLRSDGQIFATLARDPSFERAEVSFRSEDEAAYRAQRPLMGWLAAALSVGRSGWVPGALAVAGVVGAGSAVAATGLLLADRGRSPWFGLVVVAMPGTLAALSILTAETVVLGLLAWALVAWERKHLGMAVVLFSIAVLGRETAALVPAALVLACALRREWRRGFRLLPVFVVMLAWYIFLRARFGAWPWEAGAGRMGAPFRGLLAALDGWEEPAAQGGVLFIGILLFGGSLLRARADDLTIVAVGHAAFGALMGSLVWADWPHFSRLLLPMYVAAFVALLSGPLASGDRASELAMNGPVPRSAAASR